MNRHTGELAHYSPRPPYLVGAQFGERPAKMLHEQFVKCVPPVKRVGHMSARRLRRLAGVLYDGPVEKSDLWGPAESMVIIAADVVSAAEASETKSARLPGPIRFVGKLLEAWRLEPEDAVWLLGGDQDHIGRLMRGSARLAGRDIKDRIAYLFRIRQTLSSLFRDEDTENAWLREPHELLNGRAPLQLLREGSMEAMLTVKEYVDAAAGR